MGEPPLVWYHLEVVNMSIHDKYRLVKINDQLQEIEVAIANIKGKTKPLLVDFLPR